MRCSQRSAVDRNRSRSLRVVISVALVGLLLSGESRRDVALAQRPTSSVAPDAVRLASDSLPNLIQVHPKVLTGGQPEGNAGFEELSRRGVKTIISVDGATPSVDLARQFGMRYVHLPHGYDGISPDRARELAKAVDELEGPIYIHCHHGKHRSPAAAAVACVTAGMLGADEARELLMLAGTNPNYRGLFRSVASARPLDRAEIDQMRVDYREVAEITPLVTAMLGLERTLDKLRSSDLGPESLAASQTDDPVVEHDRKENAWLLREHFTELIRSEKDRGHPKAFMEWLRDSEQAAEALIKALDESFDEQEKSRMHQTGLLQRIRNNCAECHAAHRDGS